jgi:hypothetical protein
MFGKEDRVPSLRKRAGDDLPVSQSTGSVCSGGVAVARSFSFDPEGGQVLSCRSRTKQKDEEGLRFVVVWTVLRMLVPALCMPLPSTPPDQIPAEFAPFFRTPAYHLSPYPPTTRLEEQDPKDTVGIAPVSGRG